MTGLTRGGECAGHDLCRGVVKDPPGLEWNNRRYQRCSPLRPCGAPKNRVAAGYFFAILFKEGKYRSLSNPSGPLLNLRTGPF